MPGATMTELAPWRFGPIEPVALERLAVVLDDPNPIHLDADAVAALGLGDRPVNQGPANVGYVLTMLGEIGPDATVERIDVRFLENVFAGDRVVGGGEIERDLGETRVGCRVWLDVEGGGRALEGSAVVRVTAW